MVSVGLLGKMVSRLETGSDAAPIVSFVPGTAVCLACGEDGDGWTIAWMITPELHRPDYAWSETGKKGGCPR